MYTTKAMVFLPIAFVGFIQFDKLCFTAWLSFEKNNKYTPKINLMAASLYAKNTKGIFEKIYPVIILIVHIVPNKIIDFPCTK